MRLYAIGDLHLSFGADKPLDVFGKKWTGYVGMMEFQTASFSGPSS